MHDADDTDLDEGQSEEEASEVEPVQTGKKTTGGKAKSEASHLGMARKDGSLSLHDQEELALKLLSKKYA